jgi:hypothetical protein
MSTLFFETEPTSPAFERPAKRARVQLQLKLQAPSRKRRFDKIEHCNPSDPDSKSQWTDKDRGDLIDVIVYKITRAALLLIPRRHRITQRLLAVR